MCGAMSARSPEKWREKGGWVVRTMNPPSLFSPFFWAFCRHSTAHWTLRKFENFRKSRFIRRILETETKTMKEIASRARARASSIHLSFRNVTHIHWQPKQSYEPNVSRHTQIPMTMLPSSTSYSGWLSLLPTKDPILLLLVQESRRANLD